MSTDREYADSLKKGIKELVDSIRVDNEQDLEVLKLVYGFVRAGFLENRAGKQFGLMDDNGFLNAMPARPPELPVKSQRKNEIISMIGEISDRRGTDMIYGFVRRLYREEQGNGKKRQGQYCNGNSE